MSGFAIGAAVAGTALLGTAAGFTAGAFTLFNRVIPRQDQLRVDISEMADMDRWEEYKGSADQITPDGLVRILLAYFPPYCTNFA